MSSEEGTLIIKGSVEYNPEGKLHGIPFFIVREVGKAYVLYEYHPQIKQYKLFMETNELSFQEIHRLLLAKDDELQAQLSS
ncbi:MAG: hypothetical protein HUU38_07965 [Anaerolineales bacterium]|nr:hypothetical protein [Anaerolineales bacterium]